MKIKSTFLGLIIITIVFGGIFATSALNIWKTTSSKIPQKLTQGDFAGEYDPADIRGSYSFNDVSKAFNIPLEDLKAAFALPDNIDASSFKNKDLKEFYEGLKENIEIENASVKLFVSLYTGLPYEMDEEIYLPKQAVDILKTKSSLTKEQVDYLDNHMVDIDSLNQKSQEESSIQSSNNTVSNSQETNDNHNINDKLVRGTTTFKEVLDWGISKETVEEIIVGKIPDTNILIRDYCRDKGIQFSTVKETLQNEINNIN